MFFPLLHLMNTGLGPFYDGLAHFFTTPEDVLPVLALALWSGLRGAPRRTARALRAAARHGSAAARSAVSVSPHWIWPVASAALDGRCSASSPRRTDASRRRRSRALALVLGLWNGVVERHRARTGSAPICGQRRRRGMRRLRRRRPRRRARRGRPRAVGSNRGPRRRQLDRRGGTSSCSAGRCGPERIRRPGRYALATREETSR